MVEINPKPKRGDGRRVHQINKPKKMLEKNAQIILGKLIKVHQKGNVEESLREGEA